MLSQQEADRLIHVPKRLVGVRQLTLPGAGGKQAWSAESLDGRETFLFDMNRGRISLQRLTLQERNQTVYILLRLDIAGPPHTNPDGTKIPAPHLHIYREGYNDKWAFLVPPDLDIASGDLGDVLAEFLRYSGVVPVPPIQRSVLE